MIFRVYFLLLLTFFSTLCLSQDKNKNDIRDVSKVTFFSPGFTIEKRTGNRQSLSAQAVLNTSIYAGWSSSMGTSAGITAYPALELHYRYYYNALKREAKGKRTEMNSQNFLSAIGETYLFKEQVSYNGEKDLRAGKILGILWGLQRNYSSRFSLNLSLGLGYSFWKDATWNDVGQVTNRNVAEMTPLILINLGFWLNKRE